MFCIFRTVRISANQFRLVSSSAKVFIESYGCQMNFSDANIVRSILKDSGHEIVADLNKCDCVLLMTCAVRDSAEAKIWHRLKHLRQAHPSNLRIGVLGCMATRLKESLLRHRSDRKQKVLTTSTRINFKRWNNVGADFVCGPDAYRQLPHLVGSSSRSGMENCLTALSLEETYADIAPVQQTAGSPTAFLSIMRGCNNMCTYCIVPFVRGRERSRPLDSILDEVRLLRDQGVREVTLLGQNVNSYNDLTNVEEYSTATLAPGFQTVYKTPKIGRDFASLLDEISLIDPSMRIRFTSPHPKDFSDAVLQLIAERPNICKNLHLPAQSGSTTVLERMQRGYSRESYLKLVQRAKEIIGDRLALSSDFIAGFCGETEQDHEQTLSLMSEVGYAFSFWFPYSQRQKTRAYHRLQDDVPEEAKSRRHLELKALGESLSLQFNTSLIGSSQLVLVEGTSRRDPSFVYGRTDSNRKVFFPPALRNGQLSDIGDYVHVHVTEANQLTLRGEGLTLACSL